MLIPYHLRILLLCIYYLKKNSWDVCPMRRLQGSSLYVIVKNWIPECPSTWKQRTELRNGHAMEYCASAKDNGEDLCWRKKKVAKWWEWSLSMAHCSKTKAAENSGIHSSGHIIICEITWRSRILLSSMVDVSWKRLFKFQLVKM